VNGTLALRRRALTLNFTNPIFGFADSAQDVKTVTLTAEPLPEPKEDIEYLFSGIWMDTDMNNPKIACLSGNNWSFSLPKVDKKEVGKFYRYDRKAAFFNADGTFYGKGDVLTEEAELVGNTVNITPLSGTPYELTLNPNTNPYIENWLGGDNIEGSLYIRITDWSLESSDGNIVAEGEYLWKDGDKAYFINKSDGTLFATATLSEGKDVLTFTASGVEQEFTLIPNPFIGHWRGNAFIIVQVNAYVTGNVYSIRSVAGDMDGQYFWRNVGGVNTAYFYSNGHSYGRAVFRSATQIRVNTDEPIGYGALSTSQIDMNRQN